MLSSQLLPVLILFVSHRLDLSLCVKNVSFHRTSDLGTHFLLVVSYAYFANAPNAEVVFMTFHYEVTVSMRIPRDMYLKETEFDEHIFQTKNEASAVKTFQRNSTVNNNTTGHAIEVRASEDIKIIVYIWDENNLGDIYVFPPVSSYSQEFFFTLPAIPPFVLTLAFHDNTVVTYGLHLLIEKSYLLPCSWNDTCGHTERTTTFVLNSTTFSYISWAPYGIEFPKLKPSSVAASRPILVILGLTYDHSGISVVPSGKIFLIPGSTNTITGCGLSLKITNSLLNNTIKLISKDDTMVVNLEPLEMNYKSFDTVEFALLEADHPVSVIIYTSNFKVNHMITCNIFILSVVPNRMWSSFAMFRKPSGIKTSDAYYSLIVLSFTNQRDELFVNGNLVNDWKPVILEDVQNIYRYARIEITHANEYRIIQKDPRDTFIAYVRYCEKKDGYIFGSHLGISYSHPLMPNDACLNQKAAMSLSDDIDNDCDGRIDEEEWNGVDDDADGHIDEDVMTYRTAGEWGPWKSWHYDDICRSGMQFQGRLQRYRSCDSPPPTNKGDTCKGFREETWNALCEKNCSVSNRLCPLGKFKQTCTDHCSRGCFMELCDQFIGTCFSCKGGYKPSEFCDEQDYLLVESDLPPPNKSMSALISTKVSGMHNIWIVFALTAILVILLIVTECFLLCITKTFAKKVARSTQMEQVNENVDGSSSIK